MSAAAAGDGPSLNPPDGPAAKLAGSANGGARVGAAAPSSAAADLGTTWCRRAARAVKQRLLDSQQLFREYQYVVALDDTIRHGQSDALRADSATRNRYANVLPYNYNRVHLPPSCGSTYINASHIQLQPPHTAAPATYIATQGPLPHTAEHFWRMALEARAPLVVMLTNCIEKGAVKCAQYFPDAPGEAAQYGSLRLDVVSRDRFSADCERRVLRLTDLSALHGGGGGEGGATLELQHFHYHTWPDHGAPEDSRTLRRLCRELQRARAAAGGGGGGRPVVIGDSAGSVASGGGSFGAPRTPVLHCSAGIGRTGTFIAMDVIIRRIDAWFREGGPTKEEVESALDMPLLVHSLRQQRGGMVQTLEQYYFLYKATLDELEERQAAVAAGAGAAAPGGR